MSVFPGTLSALLNGQTWFARPGAAGLLFQLTLGRHLSLPKKKNKNNNNPTCRDRCAQSLVRESCSHNNVVEPVGKTSLVLDTVFGHDLEKEKTEHTKSYWKLKKRLSVRLRSGDKHHLRKSADHKAQISPVSETNAFLICALRSADFLGWCLSPERNLTHNLFFYFQ